MLAYLGKTLELSVEKVLVMGDGPTTPEVRDSFSSTLLKPTAEATKTRETSVSQEYAEALHSLETLPQSLRNPILLDTVNSGQIASIFRIIEPQIDGVVIKIWNPFAKRGPGISSADDEFKLETSTLKNVRDFERENDFPQSVPDILVTSEPLTVRVGRYTPGTVEHRLWFAMVDLNFAQYQPINIIKFKKVNLPQIVWQMLRHSYVLEQLGLAITDRKLRDFWCHQPSNHVMVTDFNVMRGRREGESDEDTSRQNQIRIGGLIYQLLTKHQLTQNDRVELKGMDNPLASPLISPLPKKWRLTVVKLLRQEYMNMEEAVETWQSANKKSLMINAF